MISFTKQELAKLSAGFWGEDYEAAPIRQVSGYAWELYDSLEQIIAAHKTGRNEPLQAAIEAALDKLTGEK